MPRNIPVRLDAIGVSNDFIFIVSKGELHKFDKMGDYISPIGRRGRGPQEYLSASEIFLYESQQQIFVKNSTNILVYDFNGNFIERIEKPSRALSILVSDSILYQSFDTFDGVAESKVIAIDNHNDTILNIPNYHSVKGAQMSMEMGFREKSNPLYRYGSKILHKGYGCDDTVYSVHKNKYAIHAIVDMGKYKRPQPIDPMKSYMEIAQAKGDYYQLPVFIEDDNYFYIKCISFGSADMKDYFFVYDKNTQKGFKVENEGGALGITDDINGGAPIIPILITDKAYIAFKEAVSFIDNNILLSGKTFT